VPSYRRSTDLARCLAAIAEQTEPPGQVVVVLRADDVEGRAVVAAGISSGMPITEVLAERPGHVAALNAGVRASRCDVTAITDDDAAPRPDWVARVLDHFADPIVAGVGGRDIVNVPVGPLQSVVGVVGWYGRTMGNHHLGQGPARSVDTLKGANMSFRTSWLERFGFDERLRGKGVELHNDLSLCLQIRRAGGRLMYDPQVQVDHYPAPRPDGNHDRSPASLAAMSDEVHNETLALWEYLPPWRRAAWLVWATGRGTRRYPGVAVTAAAWRSGGRSSAATLSACLRGRIAGLVTWRQTSG
jgi:cellulose synthase/poly-beta-1,6-N-acetylglucosamine synthase-like glycosyltransferase